MKFVYVQLLLLCTIITAPLAASPTPATLTEHIDTRTTEGDIAEKVAESGSSEKKQNWKTRWFSWWSGDKSRVTLSHMNFDQLMVAKNKAVANKDFAAAVIYLEKMYPLCSDLTLLGELMYELAEIFFQTGKLEKSGNMYREFLKLYPGSVHAEHATYRTIACSFIRILSPDRDQTHTRKTIELTDLFLKHEKTYTVYVNEVRTIRSQCYERLAESELYVAEFYAKKGANKSCQRRLDNIRKELLEHVPHFESRVIAFEIEWAQRMNDATFAAAKETEFHTKFPTMVIADATPRKSWWHILLGV